MRIRIIGGGIFGVCAAWELARRGHRVALFEAGEIPSEKAASRDLSKALRMEYGAETGMYAPWVERAREDWLDLEKRSGRKIYHESGFLCLSKEFVPGGFEHDSYHAMKSRGYDIESMPIEEARKRFSHLNYDGLEHAFFSPVAGWLDPMQAMPALTAAAEDAGAQVRTRTQAPLSRRGFDATLVTAGAWIAKLLALNFSVRVTSQHESFFRPLETEGLLRQPLPLWCVNVAVEGWYGFPLHPGGVLKIACHNPGPEADPDGGREGDSGQASHIRGFVQKRLAWLQGALEEGRTCLYTMSPNGTFLFDSVPDTPGLFVAGCGSGHAFKFGPMLGRWAADLVEGKEIPSVFRARGKQGDRVL